MLSVEDIIAIKKIALKNIQSRSIESFIDRAYRHYSTTYFTPLKQAYELPESEVTLIYFEDMFKNMEAHVLEDELNSNLEIDHAVVTSGKKVVDESKLSDDQWMAQQIERIKKQKQEQDNKVKAAIDDNIKKLEKITGSSIEKETITFEDIEE